MQPLYDALRDMIPAEKLASFIENGTFKLHLWLLCVDEH